MRNYGEHRRSGWSYACPCAVLAWAALFALGLLPAMHAQGPGVVIDRQQEFNLKATYLYSFGKFVTWPDEAFDDTQSPFVIGVMGGDDFGGALDEIAKKRTIQGRPVAIRHFEGPDDYQPSHVLYISQRLPAEKQAAVLKKLAGTPVLTLAESPGLGQQGANVNFFIQGANVMFELNIPSAKQNSLQISPQLSSLKVVRLIGAQPQRGRR